MRYIFIAILLTAPAVHSFAQSPGAERIAAIVNGDLILTGEIETFIQRNQTENADLSRLTEEQRNELNAGVLDRLIDNRLIIQGIEAQLAADRKALIRQNVERQLSQIIEDMQKPYTTPEQLAQREQQMGISWDELREIQYENLYRDYLIRVVAPALLRDRISPPTDEEMQAFREENPDAASDEIMRAAHILIRVPDDASEVIDNQALSKARQIAMQAREGESFEALAMTHSDHNETKTRGGMLPDFRRGQFYPEFDALFDLEENDISDPIRTPSGYHVVKVLKKDTPQTIIMRRKLESELKNWVDELREDADIDIRLNQ